MLDLACFDFVARCYKLPDNMTLEEGALVSPPAQSSPGHN